MDGEKLKYQIGANIAAYRKQAGLTQAGLAENRESGTEPVIRVMVEAESKDICEQYVDSVVEVIRRKGHTV